MANSDRQVKAIDKTSRALEMRKSGATYALIASELGYANESGAYKAVMRALKKTLQEPADEVRMLEVERLDALLSGLWARKNTPEVTDRILRIMERRAKLLGLDSPVRSDVTSGGEVLPIVYVNDWRESGE
jgi:hypothetical protein